MGLIVGALGIGIFVALVSWAQSCFFDHKQWKVERRIEQWNEKHKFQTPVKREKEGYTVSY